MRDLVRRMVVCGAALGALVAADAGVAAAATGEGTAKGKSAQGRVVRLRVDGNRLELLRFTAKLQCRDGSILIVEESGFMPTRLSRGGLFSEKQFGSTDVVRFKGEVATGAVRGKIRVSDFIRVKPDKDAKRRKVRCDSRWFKFNAQFQG